MEYVNFGNTGLRVSRLSIGTGTGGWGGRSEQTGLGLDGLSNLLRQGYDLGINFWDSADQYGSHRHIAQALQSVPRDQVVISTKTTSRDGRSVTEDVERYLRELNTNVLDIVLMHFLTQANWPKRYASAMEALSRAKEQGKVRAVGVSCHDFGALKQAAASDWADVVLVRINHAGANMDAQPNRVVPVIEQMYQSGKAVYGMKVYGAGRLTRDTRAAMEYVFKLGTVYSVTIGTSNLEQLQENVQLVEEIARRCPIARPLRPL